MQLIDLRTVVGVTGLMSCLMSIILYFQGKAYDETMRGFKQWVVAAWVAATAAILFSLRGIAPDWLTIGMANILLVYGVGLFIDGTSKFFLYPIPRYFLPALVVISAIVLWFLRDSATNYSNRVAFVSMLMAILCSLHAAIIFKHGKSTFATRLTLCVLVSQVVIFLLRGATAFFLSIPQGLFENTLIQTLYLLNHSIGMLLVPIGIVLIASEELRYRLHELATEDSLTKTLTRRALLEAAETELARAKRNGQPLSILMLDLDHFKAINDQFGHGIGDTVLCDFANRARQLLRKPSLLGRYGGEEFIAVLPSTDAQQALQVAARICSSKSMQPELPRWTLSIGVATGRADSEETLASLIDRADKGLYLAKSRGRNRVEVALAC